MSFNLLPDDYELPRVSLTIKLRENDGTNRKAPTLKGFIAIDEQAARNILRHIEANGGVVFLDTALWTRNDGDYAFTGNVNISNYTPPTDKPKEARDNERSPWY